MPATGNWEVLNLEGVAPNGTTPSKTNSLSIKLNLPTFYNMFNVLLLQMLQLIRNNQTNQFSHKTKRLTFQVSLF